MLLNLLLWTGGVFLVVMGVVLLRRPLARFRELEAVDENARRYDAWRGGTRTVAGRGGPSEITGADVMRQQLRRQLFRSTVLVAVGVALIISGFLIR